MRLHDGNFFEPSEASFVVYLVEAFDVVEFLSELCHCFPGFVEFEAGCVVHCSDAFVIEASHVLEVPFFCGP